MSTPTPSTPDRRCAVPEPDGKPCPRPVYCRGMCSPHYWRKYRADHNPRPPQGRSRSLYGSNPQEVSFWVPGDLAEKLKAAVAQAGCTKARWLEDAIRAHLPPELTPIK